MAQGKSKLPWILGGIAAFMLLCCGGVVGGGYFFFKTGMESAQSKAPFASEVMTKMSDSNYEFDSVANYFDASIFSGIQLDQFKVAMAAYRDRLGKFEAIGNATGFNSSYNNGVTTSRYTFNASFEKAEGILTFAVRNQNGIGKIVEFSIDSVSLK